MSQAVTLAIGDASTVAHTALVIDMPEAEAVALPIRDVGSTDGTTRGRAVPIAYAALIFHMSHAVTFAVKNAWPTTSSTFVIHVSKAVALRDRDAGAVTYATFVIHVSKAIAVRDRNASAVTYAAFVIHVSKAVALRDRNAGAVTHTTFVIHVSKTIALRDRNAGAVTYATFVIHTPVAVAVVLWDGIPTVEATVDNASPVTDSTDVQRVPETVAFAVSDTSAAALAALI